jgi:hypothetical protein
MIAFLSKNKFSFLILSFIIVLYGDTIYYGYIWDDFDLVILKFTDIIEMTRETYLIRPVMFLSYFLTNYFYSSSTLDHIANIILFALAAKLLYDFTIKTHNKLAAFFIMIVWISLPWLSHTIVWISQRNDTLMIIFSLLAIKYDGNKETLKSCMCLLLSVFSKITSFLLPLYLIYKNRNNKKKVLIYSFIQSLFLFIGLLSFLRGGTKLKHLSELSFIESILLKFFHVFEGIVTQAIPLPYFFNKSHLAFYITIMLVGLIFLKYQKSITSQKIELALLFLIFSIPLAINSELRIAITSSYFIISLVFLSVRSNNFSKLFLLIFIAHNIWVTIISKKNYFSGEYSLENYVAGPENGFYNNDFYRKKRVFLIKAKENIKKY